MQQASSAEQRRSAYRQSVAIVPKVAHIVYGGVARRKLRLGVLDLSASGVSIRSKDELRTGDLIELQFEVDGELYVQARVRRVARGDRVWDAGCAFEGLTERQADRIVKFIFTQQRVTLRARRNDQ
jgi:c-di-GMP-binding flagellar brake protein YcgR